VRLRLQLLEPLVAQPLDVRDGQVGREQRAVALLRGDRRFLLCFGLGGALRVRLHRLLAFDRAHQAAAAIEHLDVEVHALGRNDLPEKLLTLRIPAAIDGFLAGCSLWFLRRRICRGGREQHPAEPRDPETISRLFRHCVCLLPAVVGPPCSAILRFLPPRRVIRARAFVTYVKTP
jgi:hypothetical protein